MHINKINYILILKNFSLVQNVFWNYIKNSIVAMKSENNKWGGVPFQTIKILKYNSFIINYFLLTIILENSEKIYK